MHRSALQTITWGDPQHDRFDQIFAVAAGSGFAGVEIGFRRLRQVEASTMADLLNQHGLELSASHIGGNLEDPSQATAEGLDIASAVSYLKQLGVTRLMQSGLRGLTGGDLDQAIEHLNDAARYAADHGISLLYHNHDWEFANDGAVFKRLRERACPELGFGPDLGWAAAAGVNLASLLDDLGDQIQILHFKDFAPSDDGGWTTDTCHLGVGAVDFSPAWDWLAAHPDQPCWVTAEQDRAENADVAAAANGAWLNQGLTNNHPVPGATP